MTCYKINDKGVLLYCHVQPKASRDRIAGIHDNRLKIQITAPPVEGKANKHLTAFIAKSLGVAKSRVTIISGDTGKQKTCLIADLKALPEGFLPL